MAPLAAALIFVAVHFAFSWAALLLNFMAKRSHYPRIAIPNWYLASLISVTLIGIVMILSLDVPGGSVYYFSSPSVFLAIPMIIVIVSCLDTQAIMRRNLRPSWKASLAILSLLLIVLGCVGTIYYSPAVVSGFRTYAFGARLNQPNTNLGFYLSELVKIRDVKDKMKSVVYIPRTDPFWGLMSCRASTYVIPAISEHPAIYGWPDKACYDFLCGPRFHSDGLCDESLKSYNDAQLLSEAKKIGYQRVYIVGSNGTKVVE
jgi:hypothetical protein